MKRKLTVGLVAWPDGPRTAFPIHKRAQVNGLDTGCAGQFDGWEEGGFSHSDTGGGGLKLFLGTETQQPLGHWKL